MNKKETAQRNLQLLRENVYPGRGIICGMDESGQYLVQVYWIMGRSPNSRNRIFIVDDKFGKLKTEVANPDLVKDPSLIIYTAMAERNLRFVVSNGHQTMAVIHGPTDRGILSLLKNWAYEPDEPNFTPRITASIFLGEDSENYTAEMAVFRKDGQNETCLKVPHLVNLKPGLGYCITTYSGDGNPLPSFSGQPYLLPLSGDSDDILDTFWNALNEDNRVSLAVKFIEIATGTSKINVVNQYSQVEV